MDWTSQRERYRALLAGNRCVFPASVYDPISARIADMLGFEVGMFAGSLAAMAVLGDPDLILITLSEFAEQAYRICRASPLAIQLEVDHGYGNALNVMRSVEELETAGAAAIMIEDALLPQPFGKGDGKGMVSIEEAAAKMRAGVRARQDPKLTIVGRSIVARAGNVPEILARARAYEGAGVDALYFSSVNSKEMLEAIAGATKIPILLGAVPEAMSDLKYLASQRVRTCLQGHQPIRAAANAMYETMKALRDGTKPSAIANLGPDDLLPRITREDRFEAWTKEFLET